MAHPRRCHAEVGGRCCVIHGFQAQVRSSPHRPAVRDASVSLTYQELNSRANQLAALLRARGAGPERLVGIMMDRCVEMVVAVLAVLKVGAAYVPLDPADPVRRLRLIAEDCGLAIVLGEAGNPGSAASLEAALVPVDLADPRLRAESDQDPPVAAEPGLLAYVIYTSGSTGIPKGVQVEHSSLANYLSWARTAYADGGICAVPMHSALSFDFTVTSLLLPLTSGGCVEVVADYQALRDEAPAAPYSYVKLTPAHLSVLGLSADAAVLAGLTGLLVIGGEALSADKLTPWRQLPAPVTIVNEYGPTEATVGCCAYRADAAALPPGAVPIGAPIDNVTIHLLDGAEPVPDGQPGEICIGGRAVARGYLHRPGLTARRFVPDPFGPPGARLYRSGDCGRRRPDGALEYLGRLDDQVKIRGYRVDPGEIETALAAQPTVAAAAVAARPDSAGDPRIVAYVVPAGQPWSAASVQAGLRRMLPGYMLPAAFVTLPELPLNANGKVDKKRLPEPGADPGAPARRFRAPRTDAERALADIWSQVLSVARVSVDDNFFELGGQSLSAVRMIARLAQVLQVRVKLRTLFAHPTLGEFAAAVTQAPRRRARQIPGVTGNGPFPVSFGQQRIWFVAALYPGSGVYNVPVCVRMHGPLRLGSLREALDALVSRQRALRTVFPAAHGRPQQEVREDIRFPFQLTDLTGRAGAAGLLDELIEREVSRPFDLAEGPLGRAAVFRLSDTDHVLLVTVHHIIVDGPSAETLVAELGALYSRACGAGAPLPELAVQYTDYSVWQRRLVAEPAVQAQLEYWRSRLAGVPTLDLPTDRPRPLLRSAAGAAATFDLDPAAARSLRELAQGSGATPTAAALALLAVLLSRYSGQRDVAVGVPVAVRAAEVPHHLIGNFLNMAVIRIDLSGHPSLAEVIRQAGEAMVTALENSDAPFELVVDAIGVERDTSRSPLFDVSFTYLARTAPPAGTFHEITIGEYACAQRTAKFDLSLTTTETRDGMDATWEYATALFDAGTIQLLHDGYVQLLRAAASEPGEPVAELAADAIARLAPSAWGAARPLSPRCAHELFSQQAGRRPHAIAAESGGHPMTYAELDRRSNQLAAALRDLGVRPEVPVGICMARGTGLLVALLGIWKAGGAYVPLDPAFPPARLAYMVDHAQVPLIVTEGGIPGAVDFGQVRLVDLADEAIWAAAAAPRAAGPENLAYIIFTSGSTGRPKGVAVTHRSLVNVLDSFARRIRMQPADTLAAITTLSFDISVLELLLPLLAGARVVIASEAQAAEPGALSELICATGATVMQATPATWRFLAAGPGIPAQLRTRLCGGEPMPPEVAQALGGPGVTAWNVYGPTETTVWSSMGPAPGPGQPAGIGLPIDNTALYLLDASLDPVPDGVAGEIYISGAGLARGYYRAAGATAARFLPDPYATSPGQRMYRTGDLGRRRRDAAGIEFLGRVDQQVKIHGHRIEPAEVEIALAAHPAIAQAAVTPRRDGAEEPRLVAYLVPSGADVPDAGELRAHLRKSLPHYMIPADFAVLGALPLTPNCKLDRAALTRVSSESVGRSGDFASPQTMAERTLADIWADVLGLDEVGAHDNFFELGGDSIAGIQVVAKARAVGLWLEVMHIFECQTIRDLSRKASENVPRAARGPRAGRLPWVPPQYRQPDATVYVGRIPLPPLREPLAAETTARVLGRHDMLRARRLPDGAIVIAPGAPGAAAAGLPVVHASDRELDGYRADLVAAVRTGPELTRALITRAPDGSGTFLLAAHAMALDDSSWRLLAHELEAAWAAVAAGIPPPEPDPTTSYKYWSDRLHEYAESGALRADAGYWQELADDLAPSAAPAVAAGCLLTSGREPVAADVTGALLAGEAASWYGASPRELLLAAVVLTVCPAPSARPLLVHVDTDGRDTPFPDVDLSRTVGPLAAGYPVRLSRGPDAAATVRGVGHELRRVPKGGLPYYVAAHPAADPGLAARMRGLREQCLRVSLALEPGTGAAELGLDTVSASTAAAMTAPPAGGGRPLEPEVQCPEVRCTVSDGLLHVEWLAPAGHEQAGRLPQLRAGLARQTTDLVLHARAARAAGGGAPAAFPLARLTQAQLSRFTTAAGTGRSRFAGSRGKVTDVYPLAPAQHGMLFHSLYSPGEELYVNQTTLAVDGSLDLEAFGRALSAVMRRHAALRSAICWKGLAEPHQVVHGDVQPDLRIVDAAAIPGFRVEKFLAEDRAAGFDPGTPPLWRVTVVRLSPGCYLMAWTTHHAMLDGWSVNMVMDECWRAYRELAAGQDGPDGPDGPHGPHGPQYRDYIAWLSTQNGWEAGRLWARMLDGAVPPAAAVPLPAMSGTGEGVIQREVAADAARFCRDHRLTPAVLVYAGWAAALGREADRRDPMFGIVLSGRSAPVAGIDRIAGLCANTVPMRVSLPCEDDAEFLKRLQRLSFEITRFEHSPLREVERFARLPPQTALFDSTVAVQTYPMFDGDSHWMDGAVTLRRTGDAGRTNYALSVEARPEKGISLRIRFDRARVDPARAEFLAKEMCAAIAGLIEKGRS